MDSLNVLNFIRSINFLDQYETEAEKREAVNSIQKKAFVFFKYLLIALLGICLCIAASII